MKWQTHTISTPSARAVPHGQSQSCHFGRGGSSFGARQQPRRGDLRPRRKTALPDRGCYLDRRSQNPGMSACIPAPSMVRSNYFAGGGCERLRRACQQPPVFTDRDSLRGHWITVGQGTTDPTQARFLRTPPYYARTTGASPAQDAPTRATVQGRGVIKRHKSKGVSDA